MKYFDAFAGYGGFSLGIKQAYVDNKTRGNSANSNEEVSQHPKRDKPISKRQQEENDRGNSPKIKPTKNTSGALLQDRQEQGNTKPRDMEKVEGDSKLKQPMGQTGDGNLSEGGNLRNKSKVLQRQGDKPNSGSFIEQPVCIGFSEIDKYAIQVYNKHFNHKNYGSITDIIAKELPDFDLLCGGVPCQSWSIAGKRGGFEDERGNMWFQFSKILRAKQPKYFLAENVKGLLSHDGGKSMERICEELCDCGYVIDFEILNAKHFGVPQNRERVFIIGIRLDLLDKCQIF